MESYGLIVLLVYMGFAIYIIPKQGLQFDMYQIKFRLFPHWFKFVSVAWILISLAVLFLFFNTIEHREEYFVSSLNLSLFVFLFSKQKEEDEFSQHIRFKALTYTFVFFVAIGGAFGTLDIQNETGSVLNKLNFLVLLGTSMFMAVLYFYITLFRTKSRES